MKKYIAFLAAFTFVFSFFVTGCASADTPIASAQPQFDALQPGPMPELPPERSEEAVPADFIGSTNESSADMTVAFPSAVDMEQIFSDRDLDCSPDLSDAIAIPAKDHSDYTIQSAGIYVLTGKAVNFTVRVEADEKDDKVQIVLKDAVITNDNFPVIYVKSADKCFVTSLGSNTLSVSSPFVSDGDTNTDAVIFSKDDLTLNGTGSLAILSAAGNGITAKDDLKITGGSCEITSAKDAVEANDSISIYDGNFIINAGKDGFHCENDESAGSVYIRDGSFAITAKDDGIQATAALTVDGGTFSITAAEGMEATYVQINDGNIHINASDDGINAARKSNAYDVVIEINGGEITVVMGPGDTDGLDANGRIIVNGGTIDVTGNSAFDADQGSTYNGGTIIINGTKVDSIPASMMGGHGGFGGFGGNKGDRQPGGFGSSKEYPQQGGFGGGKPDRASRQ